MKKIGYISYWNPKIDKFAWSGTHWHICQSIEKAGFEVVWIPIKTPFFVRLFNRLLSYCFLLLKKKSLAPFYLWTAFFENLTIKKKKLAEVDYIFTTYSSQLYFLKSKKKIILYGDATFAQMLDYYDSFTNLNYINKIHGQRIAQKAYSKATIILAASEWNAKSIEVDYNIPSEKVKIFKFGANIQDDKIIISPKIDKSTLDIIFIGVDWVRKGGDIAVSCCKCLINQGIDVRLHVVGCNVPIKYSIEKFIVQHGFLNKNNKKDYEQFIGIITSCDILLVPTKAEAAGIMFCEASAYGLPIFTYHTGGTPSYVFNGINGYGFPIQTDAAEFALKIRDCIMTQALDGLRLRSRNIYEQELSWSKWTIMFKELLQE